MEFPTVDSARAIRDGGIDAMAALDACLHTALAGLSPDAANDVKRLVGNVMGEIVQQCIKSAIRQSGNPRLR